MTDYTPQLIRALRTLDSRLTVWDGSPTRPATGPEIIVHGGQQTPENRRYGYTARSRETSWMMLCVSNSQEGARRIAALVVDQLDGATLPGDTSLLTCRAASTPTEDRDDPAEYRWSVTIHVTHHT